MAASRSVAAALTVSDVRGTIRGVALQQRILLAAILLGVAVSGASAQEGSHPAGCLALSGTVSRELMQRPLALSDEAGRLHQQVSTASLKAQAYYDQGIAYLASYVWAESARSFHEALRLDAKVAMAELGLAKAYENADAPDEALIHLERAEALAQAGGATEKEKAWIRIGRQQRDALHAADAEQADRLAAYRAAIDALVALDPGDPHAWVLRGNAEEPGVWGRGQAGGESSIPFYTAALARDPHHLGAHHYLAHSYENIGLPAKAAEHARRYASEARGVPHAQHMLGHVLPRLGQWQEAQAQFIAADRLERDYIAREKIAPEEDWHHGHNLHLLGAVSFQLGDDAAAESAFRAAYDLGERGIYSGAYSAPYVQFLMLRGRNQEALVAAVEMQARTSKFSQLMGVTLGGEALLGLGRVDEARAALARAEMMNSALLVEVANTPYSRFTPVLTAYLTTLRGRLLLRGEQPQDGETILVAQAEEVGGNPRLDAWATGLLRVDLALADANQLGRKEMAAQIRASTARFSPRRRAQTAPLAAR